MGESICGRGVTALPDASPSIRFCGFKDYLSLLYSQKSLPYKTALKDENLQARLNRIFKPIIVNAEQYVDLGSSQQCANREVTLRAPKSLQYGNSEYLDYRVHATSAFIDEGRKYILQVSCP
ncbi:hypothetical protein KP79_PYT25054 [Mizuhopecten yessoensis]|uniref:Uncharacterized protein n=1 Tax=Mizuhopecten yessoensis TaxID=6573 RepID=A0A210PY52_MIZYE|nr:hypothetical protein KP79_PYT25054 [Mizuhopecten yessoensis]